MEFTNVLPGVKLVKQDEAGNEEELFVSQNDQKKKRPSLDRRSLFRIVLVTEIKLS